MSAAATQSLPRALSAARGALTPPIPRGVGAALIALAVIAAAALPGRAVGLGVSLACVGVLVCAALASARAGHLSWWTLGLWLGALALTAMATFRAAGWVVAMCLATAAGLASLAAAGGRSGREVTEGALALARWLVPGPAIVFAVALARTNQATWRRLGAVARGCALAAALLVVFGALFAAADGVFAHLIDELFDVELDRPWARGGVFLAVLAVAGGLVLTTLSRSSAAGEPPAPPPARLLGRTEWTIALGALNILFAVFVVIQLAVFFGGDRHVVETAGLTYADYARQGFGQLCAVAALTLAVVAGARRWARRTGAGDELVLRVLLGALCLLCLVVVAAALRRLGLYENAYGATRLRMLARALILWQAALLLLAGAAIAAWHSRPERWLPRAAVALTASAVLAFAIADPDRRVAEAQVDRFYRGTGNVDLGYLTTLSADATPALARLPRREAQIVLLRVRVALARRGDGAAGFNLARRRARRTLARAGLGALTPGG